MDETAAPRTRGVVTGMRLYPARSRTYFFLVMYAVLAAAGGVLITQSIWRNETASGAAGFMVMFGVGMFVVTLVKSRRPQVLLYEEHLELNQSRKPHHILYKNIVSVSQPDKNRLVLKLWEKGVRKDVTIWLKEFARADVERLASFLSQQGRRTS